MKIHKHKTTINILRITPDELERVHPYRKIPLPIQIRSMASRVTLPKHPPIFKKRKLGINILRYDKDPVLQKVYDNRSAILEQGNKPPSWKPQTVMDVEWID